MRESLTSAERVGAALSHREGDRVPFFLSLTMHGARELGLTIEEYYSKAEYVVEGQWRMSKRYGHDCFIGFLYASLELEAFGGRTAFFPDGPPNAAEPFVRTPADIDGLAPPSIRDSPGLRKVLEIQSSLKQRSGGATPVLGVVIAPFSLPVMQMGFGPYLDLMAEEPRRFERLMAVNETFCVEWANAQLSAGATAICYFDPVSSATIVTPEQYRRMGLPIARRVLSRLQGSAAVHFAGGRCRRLLEDVASTGAVAVGVGWGEDLADIKSVCRGRMAVLGNLNPVEMRCWSYEEAEDHVKTEIAAAAAGGGFILSDNHGEIPWQVPETVLEAISDSVRRWGRYPLDWVGRHG